MEFSELLNHSDRIVIGKVALRISHSSSLPSMPEFSRAAQTIDHMILLERFDRAKELELAHLSELQNVVVNFEDVISPFVFEAVNDAVAEAKATMRQLEEQLIYEYPLTLDEQTAFLEKWRAEKMGGYASGPATFAGTGVTGDRNVYDATLKEAQIGLSHKDAEIEKLKRELAIASGQAQREVYPDVQHQVSLLGDQSGDLEEESSRIVEEELLWHAQVRQLRAPNPQGPRDSVDRVLWHRLAGGDKTQMPFLYQVMQDIARDQGIEELTEVESIRTHCGTLYKQRQKSTVFEERFAAIQGRFLYYFAKCDGRDKCRGAVYLYGATLARVPEEEEAILGRAHVLLLTSPCPRRMEESSSTNFYLSFQSEYDLCCWERWLNEASTPKMPRSMKLRFDKEYEMAVKKGELQRGMSVSGADMMSKYAKFNYKVADSVTACEHCNTPFGLFNRKHHCANCGGVYCVRCVPISNGAKRICGMCREYGSTRPQADGQDFELC
jgi:hypothetical protein